MVFVWLPLVAATLLAAVMLASPFSRPLDRAVTQFGYRLFGGADIDPDQRDERALWAAGIGTPYRIYATKTYLYTAVGAFCGCVFGAYLGTFVLDLLNVQAITTPVSQDIFRPLPAWLTSFSVKFFVVLLLLSLFTGVVAAAGVYAVRWQIPSVRADTRRRQIDAGMPRMVAFVYALSRGGMAFPDVMRLLNRNRGVFGAGAAEMGVGVRSIELFGDDLVSATRDLSRRTPSDQFQKFTENLTSVLQSGQNLSEFLRSEYERFREQAEEQQREILELLATAAEIYVTVVVAGMLFLITILLVIGLTSGGMLGLLQLLTYLVLPATNVLFLAYLTEITQPLRATREDAVEESELSGTGSRFDTVSGGESASVATTDGGYAPDEFGFGEGPGTKANLDRLRSYKRVRRLLETVRDPVETLVEEPELLLYVTLPLAAGFLVGSLPSVFAGGEFNIRVLDDIVIQSALFVLSTYAIVYEVGRRRLRDLEAAVPELLERLASLNEAGVAVVSSFDRVRRSDVGALDEEIERIWRDIQWGGTVEGSLDRFERRVETPSVTRIVTLITNAMRASNEIGPVLRIAADQARNDLRLKRQRRQEMFTYLVVIYVAFVVFLIVIGAINYVLVPNLPTGEATAGGTVSTPGVFSVGDIDVAAYQLVFFHAALIQATMSGLVGGLMGGGSAKDGVKHATVMLAITYVIFLAFQGSDFSGQLAAVLPAFPL